jgi:RNA polymerase primary sigma factor
MDTNDTPAEMPAQKTLNEVLGGVLATLTYREREILKLRYGLGDGYIYWREEVGRIFKVTDKRVHQIEKKAIRPSAARPWGKCSITSANAPSARLL